ncbi:MAG: DUF389 domain-containing protein [Bacteroidaceae bacterium]|nr:DUF389 domain-containing protein [Bacteroidaceae bacterium]
MDIRKYFYISITSSDEQEIIESVKKGIVFKGFNLWVLVFAIFVASLGLNVNSTAVIIGAMLISPLMGPIIGMGLAVGISDFDMLKRSFKHYALSAGVSVVTATIYFLLSPINEAQSELLARTSPNIYDVLIAFFGGMAGVVAICAKEKGNVIPGVAIATALMPPLCTAGFGLAQGEWMFFFGALYLFFINTVFIGLATFLGVRFFRFQRQTYIDKKRGKLVNRYIMAIVIATIIPAVFTTVRIVRESMFQNRANSFISNELDFSGTQVIQRDISWSRNAIKVILIGKKVHESQIDSARANMRYYHLGETSLSVTQGFDSDSLSLLSLENAAIEALYQQDEQTIDELRFRLSALEQETASYRKYADLSEVVTQELHALFPTIASVSIGQSVRSYVADSTADTICQVRLYQTKKLNCADYQKLTDWLKARLGTQQLELFE